MTRPPGCIFCGKKPLTKEHVWPKWLRPYVPHDLKNFETADAAIEIDSVSPKFKKIDGDPRNRAVRVVCAECNNGWMSQLQEAVKPLLLPLVKGESVDLWPKRLSVLAAWCAMSVMCGEYIMDGKGGVIPQSERDALMKSR